MPEPPRKPCILIVTPEVTYLPLDMGNIANYLTAKACWIHDTLVWSNSMWIKTPVMAFFGES